MNRTDIPWCTHVWNPTTGCSFGCAYCYAKRISTRFGRSFAPTFHPERIDAPMTHRKPARVFVDSNGDLFDPAISFHQIAEIYSTMIQAPWHTYIILTKQAQRMRELYSRWEEWFGPGMRDLQVKPHIHLGVTVTNQADVDERIPLLLSTPAAVHFLSIEPLLGPVDLGHLVWVKLPKLVHGDWPIGHHIVAEPGIHFAHLNPLGAVSACVGGEKLGIKPHEMEWCRQLDWIIIGELSGKAPSEQVKRWAGDIIDQCRAAGTPVFVKNKLHETFPIQEYPEVKL